MTFESIIQAIGKKPYFHDDACVIYCADNREILPLIPDKSVDLVLTDPPYGIFKDLDSDGEMFGKPTIYTIDKSATHWDLRPDAQTLQSVRDLAVYHTIWGGNYFADILGSSKGCLVWDKMTGNNTYADGELAWTNTTGTMRIFHHQWCGAFKDSERGERAIHPTQKPVALMTWCIMKSPLSDTILDPYLGSGTVVVAAKKLGRKCIGIEIEEKYCEIAAKRLSQSVMELKV